MQNDTFGSEMRKLMQTMIKVWNTKKSHQDQCSHFLMFIYAKEKLEIAMVRIAKMSECV